MCMNFLKYKITSYGQIHWQLLMLLTIAIRIPKTHLSSIVIQKKIFRLANAHHKGKEEEKPGDRRDRGNGREDVCPTNNCGKFTPMEKIIVGRPTYRYIGICDTDCRAKSSGWKPSEL